MNFYGLETDRRGLVCDWQHDPEWYLDKLKEKMHINTIRLPFSYEYITNYDISKMERIIRSAGLRNMSVILDYHRTWASHQGPTPEEGLTLSDFENAWVHVLQRFRQHDNIMGVGIFNEIQTDNLNYTKSMHKRVINHIETKFPGRYQYFAGCPEWGSNCTGMDLSDMPTWNRTFIEIHKYAFSENSDPQDWDRTMPASIPSDRWLVGETGWRTNDSAWAESFLTYLNNRSIDNICLWTIAHSHDTDGWWKDDCETFEEDKAKMLELVWSLPLLVPDPPHPPPVDVPPIIAPQPPCAPQEPPLAPEPARPTPAPTPPPTPVPFRPKPTPAPTPKPVAKPHGMELSIVDRNGSLYVVQPQTIRGISIYGLETNLRNTVCSWSHPAEYYIKEVKKLGFNTIRIPVSLQYVVEAEFQVLDKMVETCNHEGMQIFLDIHRVANTYQQADPDKGIQEFDKISSRDEFSDFVMVLLSRYFHERSIIGVNSWNEYTGTDVNYKEQWDKFIFTRVENSFPGRFIMVTTGLLWGGLLVGLNIEDLPFSNRIMYSTHKYHFSNPANRQGWDASFGNVFPPHKIMIGEWGFRNPEDMWFGRDFSKYLLDKKILNQFFWTIAHSGDTGGLWHDDCNTVDFEKYDIIKPLLLAN
jgi:aryl-phospho-beta-D-glucosidase BglC (GH1 family)